MTGDLGVLQPARLRAYDVMVDFAFVESADERISALLDAVEGGKGFVGIHGATGIFSNSPA